MMMLMAVALSMAACSMAAPEGEKPEYGETCNDQHRHGGLIRVDSFVSVGFVSVGGTGNFFLAHAGTTLMRSG